MNNSCEFKIELNFIVLKLKVDRFGCSVRFCYLEFDKEAISDGCRSENAVIGGGLCILSDFRALSFCGPCGPCLEIRILHMDKLTIQNFITQICLAYKSILNLPRTYYSKYQENIIIISYVYKKH